MLRGLRECRVGLCEVRAPGFSSELDGERLRVGTLGLRRSGGGDSERRGVPLPFRGDAR